MKKTFSFVMSIILAASLLTAAASAQSLDNFQKTVTYTQGRFSDVASDDWFSLSVASACEYGLMNGRTSDTFAPDENIKLSEVVVLAARLRSIYNTGSADFKTGDPWYQNYLDYAIEYGIVSNGQYDDYDAYATRYQFAEIMAEALPESALTEINTISIGSIPDLPLTGAYQSVYTLYRAGIITGKTAAGEFCPSDNILRSEAAAIVTRLANEDLRVEFSIVKAGSSDTGTQLLTTINSARDEIDLALEYYNDAYTKAVASGYKASAESLDKAFTYTQMAALYINSAAGVCESNSKYSAAYAGLSDSYQKCLEAMSGVSAIASDSCDIRGDWDTPRQLLKDVSSALTTAYVTIKNIV